MEQEFIYASRVSPTLGTTIEVDGKTIRIKFEKKVFKTTDAALAAALDAEIARGGAMSMHVHRIDKSAAEQAAREFIARKAAAKGGYSTANLAELVGQPMAGSAAALGEMAPNNPEALEQFSRELSGDNMAITEFVHQVAESAPEVTPTANGRPAGLPQPSVSRGLNLFGQKG